MYTVILANAQSFFRMSACSPCKPSLPPPFLPSGRRIKLKYSFTLDSLHKIRLISIRLATPKPLETKATLCVRRRNIVHQKTISLVKKLPPDTSLGSRPPHYFVSPANRIQPPFPRLPPLMQSLKMLLIHPPIFASPPTSPAATTHPAPIPPFFLEFLLPTCQS